MKIVAYVISACLAASVVLFGAAKLVAQGSNDGRHMGPAEGRGMPMGRGMMRGSHHKGNPVRHRIIRHGGGVPSPYSTKKNPLIFSKAAVEAGKKLYGEHCATCHGATGEGDGEGGRKLSPKPANLAFIMDKWIATDAFLFWSLSEGGETLKTDMPAFKDVLSEKQRWQIIHYLREGMITARDR